MLGLAGTLFLVLPAAGSEIGRVPGVLDEFAGLRADKHVTAFSLSQLAQQDSTKRAACNIKGNISSRRERIYHVPGGRYYAQTIVNAAKGERWFCTEAEAKAAG
ncbi:MAG: succinoglycan biosynthesis protein exoi [Alphaproteobacteria bacterium]